MAKSPVTQPSEKTDRVRLDYLDGLRGLAALYVVCHHAYMEIDVNGDGSALPRLAARLLHWLVYGQGAVDVFIVLSGYCLMLPVVRRADGSLGRVRSFLLRRARRILPPYYAALVLSLLLLGLFPGLRHAASTRWPNGSLATPHAVIAHLLLIHNLGQHWFFAIDYPMWSVATEWQIYFALPLLVWIWRRFGISTVLLLAYGFAFAVYYFVPYFNMACPWFLGLFTLGMTAALVNFSPRPAIVRLRERCPWGALSATLLVSYALFGRHWGNHWWDYKFFMDTLLGLSTACLLVYCTRILSGPSPSVPVVLRLLQSRGAVGLGVFSYSLYLVHAPILGIVHDALGPLHLTNLALLAGVLVLGVGGALLLSYLFHRVFERPFMPGYPRTERQAEQAAIVSPAP